MSPWYKRAWRKLKGESRKVVIKLTREEYDRVVEAARFLGKSIDRYIKDHLPK